MNTWSIPTRVTNKDKPYLTYADFEEQAQRFVWSLFEVYMEGDGSGRPFFFPKPLVHITEKFFKTKGHEEFLTLIARVAAEKGNTYFVFDRGGTAKISECCRLSFKLEQSDLEGRQNPVADAIQRPAERDAQPAPAGLSGQGRR